MCDQDLKGRGFLEQNTNKHVHTHQPLCWVHHVHFLGYTWVDDPLEIVALTHHLHTFCFPCSSCLSPIKVPTQTFTWKSLRTKGEPCADVHYFMHYWTVLFQHVGHFCVPRPHFWSHVLACSAIFTSFLLLCKHLSETFMYSMWSGQVRGKLSPLDVRARACACARVYAWICLLPYVSMWHTFALQVTTQQQARSQRV